jgi:hypothetical protein
MANFLYFLISINNNTNMAARLTYDVGAQAYLLKLLSSVHSSPAYTFPHGQTEEPCHNNE